MERGDLDSADVGSTGSARRDGSGPGASSASRNGRPSRTEGRAGALPRGLVVLLGLAAAVITGAGVQAIAWLVGPVFLALTIVIVISPVRTALVRAGLPGWLATAVMVLAVQAVLVVLALVIVVSLAQLASELPQYAGRSRELTEGIAGLAAQFDLGAQPLAVALDSLDLDRLTGFVVSLLAGFASLATNLVFLLSVLLFLALEAGGAGARLAVIAEDRPRVATALRDFARGTRWYMVVTTVFGLVVAVLDTIALVLLGVPLAVLWGLLAFITNYIPNIGFVIGVAPPALLALLGGGWQAMLVVIAVYLALNFVIQGIVQPRFVGDAVGLSITVTFLALAFWTFLIGPLGAVLAIPLTLLAKALLVDIDPRARWADALLGPTPRPAAAPTPGTDTDTRPG